MVQVLIDNKDEIEKRTNSKIDLVNCRFIKPLDIDVLQYISSNYKGIITIEEGSLIGGFGSTIKNYLSSSCAKVVSMGIPDHYIEHGSRKELLDEVNLNIEGLIRSIHKVNYEEK